MLPLAPSILPKRMFRVQLGRAPTLVRPKPIGWNGLPAVVLSLAAMGCDRGDATAPAVHKLIAQVVSMVFWAESNRNTGDDTEMERCVMPACNQWTDWTEWSRCSASCGGGQRTRQRVCRNGHKCTGPTVDSRSCNEQICPAVNKFRIIKIRLYISVDRMGGVGSMLGQLWHGNPTK